MSQQTSTETRKHETHLADDPSDPVGKHRHIEVDQQAHTHLRDPEIAANLCMVNWRKPLHRFDLEQQFAFDHDIQPLMAQHFAAVLNWNEFFCLKYETACAQLETDRLSVDVFEQTRTKSAMNRDATADGRVNQLLESVIQSLFKPDHVPSFVFSFSCFRDSALAFRFGRLFKFSCFRARLFVRLRVFVACLSVLTAL
jgi:hypothetical protein